MHSLLWSEMARISDAVHCSIQSVQKEKNGMGGRIIHSCSVMDCESLFHIKPKVRDAIRFLFEFSTGSDGCFLRFDGIKSSMQSSSRNVYYFYI